MLLKYAFKAIDANGKPVKEVIEADSAEAAASMIQARGLLPMSITEQRGGGGFSLDALRERLTGVKAPELILFTKQFRTMLKAGVSIVNLLQILGQQSENFTLIRVCRTMRKDIQEGASLYTAFAAHPRVFSPLYCGMVQAGEASGALPAVLDRLIYIIDHENKIRSDIVAALQYPIIVLVFLTVAFFVLLTFVIPRFVRIFLNAKLELPLPTQICLYLYNFLSNYWYLLIGAAVAAGVGLFYYFKTPQGRYARDAAMLQIPVVGSLFIKASMSRFASIFAILQSSGVSILASMNILSGTMGNAAISREFETINERLEEGRGIADPLRKAKYFTPIMVNMVAIGEESGNLEEMLSEVSSHYDTEVEYAMKKLSDAVGPALTVGLAFVVGFFALAIFLPMWDMIGVVK
ncbi:MAG: type II secretion system F family protein [Pseudomonadota bacterium]